VHASNPGQAFPSAKADGPVFIYISPASCMHIAYKLWSVFQSAWAIILVYISCYLIIPQAQQIS
jgi:hypothetical protein